MPAATYSPTPPPRLRGGPRKIAHAAHGKLCAPSRLPYRRGRTNENPRAEARGLLNNAGSDLLSHTAAALARRPKEDSPCSAWETVCAEPVAVQTRPYKRKPASRSSRAVE